MTLLKSVSRKISVMKREIKRELKDTKECSLKNTVDPKKKRK